MCAMISALGGIGVFGEQRSGLHDLPGLAVAALRDLLGDPRALQRVLTLRIETFDCGDLFASGGGYGGQAGAHRLTVDVDSTGATQTGAATEPRAGHLQMLADDPQQRRITRYVDRMTTSCAMVLAMCWPISALPTVTVTLPSWPIAYQTLGSKLAAGAPKHS